MFAAYRSAKEKGVKRFGLHAMIASNSLDIGELVETARMLFQLAVDVHTKAGVRIELIDFGGGVGIPYRPSDKAIDLQQLGKMVHKDYDSIVVPSGIHPIRLSHECGRVITGPHGYLVTRVIHQKNTYKKYIGVDACMANLMRPGMYKAYHHITVIPDSEPHNDLPINRNLFPELSADNSGKSSTIYDVVGGLCENNDKLAIDRDLGPAGARIGDLMVIHDSGAHGHAMGFNYNGKLRSAEYLWHKGSLSMIRRAETYSDLFQTLPDVPVAQHKQSLTPRIDGSTTKDCPPPRYQREVQLSNPNNGN